MQVRHCTGRSIQGTEKWRNCWLSAVLMSTLKTKPATGLLISHQKVLFDPNGLIKKTLISNFQLWEPMLTLIRISLR